MAAFIEAVDLRKTYRVGQIEVPALRGVSFTVRRGEFVSIVGPSGSGKSTLFYLLGGLTRADQGRVEIDGADFSRLSDAERTRMRRRKIGFVFQKFNLLPTLTASANIQVARHIHGTAGKDGYDHHLTGILQLLMIEGKMARKPSELSGGEQQRVAIARAVANKPAILLADEPTGSLDSKNSEIVLNMFRELNRKFKQTIILVTHNPELVTYTDRLIEMRDGVIISDSDPSWDTESELARPARSV